MSKRMTFWMTSEYLFSNQPSAIQAMDATIKIAKPATVMRAKDGAIIEVFEWASPAAIAEAHANPRVQAMWARFAAVSDIVPLNTLFESADLFAEFEPVDLHLAPIIQPDPEHRAE